MTAPAILPALLGAAIFFASFLGLGQFNFEKVELARSA